jgi:hypothetical protein
MLIWGQRTQVRVYLKDDIAALPTITPVRPSKRDIFFPAEMHDSIPAFAGYYFYSCLVDKHKTFITPEITLMGLYHPDSRPLLALETLHLHLLLYRSIASAIERLNAISP